MFEKSFIDFRLYAHNKEIKNLYFEIVLKCMNKNLFCEQFYALYFTIAEPKFGVISSLNLKL